MAPSASGDEVLEVVVGVFGEVLGHRPAPDADFFDEGGDSLLVMAAIGRLAELTGVAVPVATFFAEPTAAAVARELSAERAP
jgi:acyl carrier protein